MIIRVTDNWWFILKFCFTRKFVISGLEKSMDREIGENTFSRLNLETPPHNRCCNICLAISKFLLATHKPNTFIPEKMSLNKKKLAAWREHYRNGFFLCNPPAFPIRDWRLPRARCDRPSWAASNQENFPRRFSDASLNLSSPSPSLPRPQSNATVCSDHRRLFELCSHKSNFPPCQTFLFSFLVGTTSMGN